MNRLVKFLAVMRKKTADQEDDRVEREEQPRPIPTRNQASSSRMNSSNLSLLQSAAEGRSRQSASNTHSGEVVPGAFARNRHGEVQRRGNAEDISTLPETAESSSDAVPRDDNTWLVEARLAPSTNTDDFGEIQDRVARIEDNLRQAPVAHIIATQPNNEQWKHLCKLLIVLGIVIVAIAVVVSVSLAVASGGKGGTDVLPWQRVGQVLNGRAAEDYFSRSISLSRDGNVMAVGANQFTNSSNPGYVSVHRYNPATKKWTRIGQELVGQAPGDQFGESLSLNGDGTILAVGADDNDGGGENAGHVRVFEYNSASDHWSQLGSDLEGQERWGKFGFSVSLSNAGDILAVGAWRDDTEHGLESGSVQLFQFKRGTSSWNQLGQRLNGQAEGERFGVSVSLSSSGNIVCVGAYLSGSNAGRVSVFEYSSASSWDTLGDPINGQIIGGEFGISVSLDDSGLVMAVGAYGIDERVLVYDLDRATSTWNQRGQTLLTQQPGDAFGIRVSLNGTGNVLAVGSSMHDANGLKESGQVNIFRYYSDTNRWDQLFDPLNGEAGGDEFGYSVALSADGRVVGVGALRRHANGDNSGSAYVFTVNQ